MTPFVTGGAGFLLAVLWFDLMFDVQVLGHNERELPNDVLVSIAGYYRRVTTTAKPMNRLVAALMIATVTSIIVQVARGDHPRWVGWTSLVLAACPILLAARRTVPHAVRLGSRVDSAEDQSRLARSICRDHIVCASAIATVVAAQLS